METKRCWMCKGELPLELFYKDKYRKDGLDNKCMRCTATRYRQASTTIRFSTLIANAKSRSKTRGEDLGIDVDYLHRLWRYQGGLCYWLGLDLELDGSYGVRNPQQASLDRLDGSLGYVAGNVVFTTQAANLGRNSTTYALFYDFVTNQLGRQPLPIDLTYLKYL